MSGFEVQWPKPNLAYSWMAKNELFPYIYAYMLICWISPTILRENLTTISAPGRQQYVEAPSPYLACPLAKPTHDIIKKY
jgi:hypothetical protein